MSLDDLLAEFGLPRRPERSYFRALLMTDAPTETSREQMRTRGGQVVYRSEHTRIQWPITIEYNAAMREGDTCLCDNTDNVREYLTAYYATAAQEMRFQVGPHYCGIGACPNRDGASYPDVSTVPTVPWHTIPLHAVSEGEATPVPDPF
jgi:hypothetical protein